MTLVMLTLFHLHWMDTCLKPINVHRCKSNYITSRTTCSVQRRASNSTMYRSFQKNLKEDLGNIRRWKELNITKRLIRGTDILKLLNNVHCINMSTKLNVDNCVYLMRNVWVYSAEISNVNKVKGNLHVNSRTPPK